ncbi:MAG TPA: hypothetical protein VMU34_03700 [Mycobacterium sp.]|nr:hypothetical protein [Mycobacterium sp.]
MQLAVRPYATAGAALVAAGVLVAPAVAPPPQIETIQVQLDQMIVPGPGALLGQILVNQIRNATILGSAVLSGTLDITTGLVTGPTTFVAQLVGGTPFLNAFGDGLAPVIVGFLNAVDGITNPSFFIGLRALNSSLTAAGQSLILALFTFDAATDVLGGFIEGTIDGLNQLAMGHIVGAVKAYVRDVINGFVDGATVFTTALGNWQSAILAALQTPLPPGVTGMSAARTALTSTASAVTSVPSAAGKTATVLVPKAQPDIAAVTTAGVLQNSAHNGVGKAAVGNGGADRKVAAIGVGHPIGVKKK